MELSEYVMDFEKHIAIKLQILADFIAKWTKHNSQTKDVVHDSPWLVYCDRAWGSVGARAAVVLISPFRIKLCYAARLQFTNESDKCTNNIAEYEAILLRLRKLRAIGVRTCVLRTDSKIIFGQIEKECIEREATLEKYIALIRRMKNHFRGFTVEHIESNKNAKVDDLAKAATHNTPMPADVFFQVIEEALVKIVVLKPMLINIIEGEDRRAPIMAYIHHYYEPDSFNEQIKMQQ
jgi:ribonuclease HI